MGKVKNGFGENRTVGNPPRLVLDGQEIEIPDEDVFAYTQSVRPAIKPGTDDEPLLDDDGRPVLVGWLPVDDDTQAVHNQGAVEQVVRQYDAGHMPGGEPAEDAPVEVWAGYIVAAGLAPLDDVLTAMAGRDDGARLHEEYNAPATEPAGNASRDQWVEWVVSQELATVDQLDGQTRDEIRDTYKQEG